MFDGHVLVLVDLCKGDEGMKCTHEHVSIQVATCTLVDEARSLTGLFFSHLFTLPFPTHFMAIKVGEGRGEA
jgi:hypothetical protein